MTAPVPILTFLLPSLLNGGAERNFLNLATQIARDERFEAHLVVVNLAATPRHTPPDDLHVVDLKCRRVSMCGPALLRYLKNNRPTAVFSALDHTNSMLLLSSWLSGGHSRTIVTLRNDIRHSLLSRKSIRARVIFLIMKYIYPHADHIIAVSQGVATAFLESTGARAENVSVILNPVLSENLLVQAAESPVHPWLDNKAHPVIVTVGRLTRQKNHALLIDAFAQVIAEKDARLIVVGEGEERPALENQIENLGLGNKVDLVGHRNNPYKFMAAADTFALSSDFEGLPTVLIEAAYCGAKLVSTDCESGPREVLENGDCGILVPVGNAMALAQGILCSLDDNHSLKARFPFEKYQCKVIAEAYLKLI